MQAIQPVRGSCAAQQRNFDAFQQEFNLERPHERLGQQTPASHYHASPRPYPERLPPASVTRVSPMISVRDVRAAVDWYRSIGFDLQGQHESDGILDWAGVQLGGAYIMMVPHGRTASDRDVSLWFRTDRVDELYVTQWFVRQ